MLADLTIKDFLAETAGSAPVPGGGSISALNGAIAKWKDKRKRSLSRRL